MKITVSMATRRDWDGVFFSIQAIRMYHSMDIEFVVLDNAPESPEGECIRNFLKSVPNSKYVPVTHMQGSWVKYLGVEHATGDYVVGIDCHVLLQPGFFEAMRSFWENNPDSNDMLTGPLIYDGMVNWSTHLDPVWRGDDFGIWATDEQALERGLPFVIPMQGMGCFSYRRKAWKPICGAFRGFGSEEWYMAEHVRKNGGRVICHPKMGWLHRFGRPIMPYSISREEKIHNYYAGWLDIYGTLRDSHIEQMTKWWRGGEDGKTRYASDDELRRIVGALTDEPLILPPDRCSGATEISCVQD